MMEFQASYRDKKGDAWGEEFHVSIPHLTAFAEKYGFSLGTKMVITHADGSQICYKRVA
jgi:hypothetical protein